MYSPLGSSPGITHEDIWSCSDFKVSCLLVTRMGSDSCSETDSAPTTVPTLLRIFIGILQFRLYVHRRSEIRTVDLLPVEVKHPIDYIKMKLEIRNI